MKEFVASVTQKGQVTIPAEIQRLLGIKPRGKVTFAVDNDQVRLLPPKYTLESAYGAVAPKQRPEDFEAIIEEAMEEHAAEVVQKMR